MADIKLSVVIVAYKSGDILNSCLKSIAKYNDIGSALEVFVVDNSPNEERVEWATDGIELENLHYIPSDNNGFGAGNNIGAKKASGDVIGFINPDIILIKPIFKAICKDFYNNKRLAMEGIRLLYDDLKPGFSFYFDYNVLLWRNWTIKLWNKLGFYNSANMFISGADIFIRKDVFYEVGCFDEEIFMYYEEPDLIRRIKKANREYIVGFNKSLEMIHLERKSTPQVPKMIGIAWQSAIYYGKKHGLDYNKKIRFEFFYYKLKYKLLKLLNREGQVYYKELLCYLSNNFEDVLSSGS